MAKVILGNHSALVVSRAEQERVRRFYRDVLGGKILRETDQKDDFCLGDGFYIAVLYESEGVLDDTGKLKAIYLELKTDNVEEMRQESSPSASRSWIRPIRTSTSRPRGGKSSDWSESTRTSPNTRAPPTTASYPATFTANCATAPDMVDVASYQQGLAG
jgi:hypothetical protein